MESRKEWGKSCEKEESSHSLQHKTKIDLENVMSFTSYLTLGSLTESVIFFTWIKIIFMSIVKSLENESI